MKTYLTKPNCISALSMLSILAVMALMSLPAAETEANRGQLSASDYKFATSAARGGQMEVDLGNLAVQKSTDPQVQNFGRHMAQEHSKAGERLKDLVAKNGATLPADLANDQRDLDRLNKLSGRDFDKAYMDYMVRDHKSDLKEFERAAKNTDNIDLRAFAAEMTSVIQEHLKMAEDVQARTKAASSEGK